MADLTDPELALYAAGTDDSVTSRMARELVRLREEVSASDERLVGALDGTFLVGDGTARRPSPDKNRFTLTRTQLRACLGTMLVPVRQCPDPADPQSAASAERVPLSPEDREKTEDALARVGSFYLGDANPARLASIIRTLCDCMVEAGLGEEDL